MRRVRGRVPDKASKDASGLRDELGRNPPPAVCASASKLPTDGSRLCRRDHSPRARPLEASRRGADVLCRLDQHRVVVRPVRIVALTHVTPRVYMRLCTKSLPSPAGAMHGCAPWHAVFAVTPQTALADPVVTYRCGQCLSSPPQFHVPWPLRTSTARPSARSRGPAGARGRQAHLERNPRRRAPVFSQPQEPNRERPVGFRERAVVSEGPSQVYGYCEKHRNRDTMVGARSSRQLCDDARQDD
jgi:hypothetical protein